MHLSVPCHGVPRGMLQGVWTWPQRGRNIGQTKHPSLGDQRVYPKALPNYHSDSYHTTTIHYRGWVVQYPEVKTIAMCEQRSASASPSRVFSWNKAKLVLLLFLSHLGGFTKWTILFGVQIRCWFHTWPMVLVFQFKTTLVRCRVSKEKWQWIFCSPGCETYPYIPPHIIQPFFHLTTHPQHHPRLKAHPLTLSASGKDLIEITCLHVLWRELHPAVSRCK